MAMPNNVAAARAIEAKSSFIVDPPDLAPQFGQKRIAACCYATNYKIKGAGSFFQ